MINTSQDPDYFGPVGHEKKFHQDHFMGLDSSCFKVWVLKRGKLARVTKAQAMARGYSVVSTGKKRPIISNVRNAISGQEPEVPCLSGQKNKEHLCE